MSDVKICPQCGQQFEGSILFCPRDGSGLRAVDGGGSLIGQVVADRYHVQKALGSGGMGQVYLAEHVKIGALRALKVINPALLKSAEAVVRFNREAANASRISHTNVVQVHDFGESPDGLIFLAMEFVDGESLGALVHRERFLPPRRAAAIALQVLDALTAAHELRIVHRDLKPENVMLARRRDGSDLVKVVDFGVSRIMEDDAQKVTSTGLVIGTVEYMSPEQFTGEPVDERSDLYSLGIVLFRMLTGELPFDGRTALQAMEARLAGAPRLAAVRPDVSWPVGLQDVLDVTLCVPVPDRYATAAELSADLEAVMREWLPDEIHATEPWNARLRGGSAGTHVSGDTPAARRARRGDTPSGLPSSAERGALSAEGGHERVASASGAGGSGAAGTDRITEPRSLTSPPALPTPSGSVGAIDVTDAQRPALPPSRGPSRATRSWSRTLAMVGGVVVTFSVILFVFNGKQRGAQLATRPPVVDSSPSSSPTTPRRGPTTVAGLPTADSPGTGGSGARGSGPTSGNLPNATPGVTVESREVIQQLARIETLTDSLATDDQAHQALRLLAQLEPRTPLGRVEAKFRALEANVKLDRTQEICRLVRELSTEGRGTRFAAGIDVFAQVAREECRDGID